MSPPIKPRHAFIPQAALDLVPTQPPPAKPAPPADTGGCMLMLPQPGGGHRMCGKPLHDLVFCKEHA